VGGHGYGKTTIPRLLIQQRGQHLHLALEASLGVFAHVAVGKGTKLSQMGIASCLDAVHTQQAGRLGSEASRGVFAHVEVERASLAKHSAVARHSTASILRKYLHRVLESSLGVLAHVEVTPSKPASRTCVCVSLSLSRTALPAGLLGVSSSVLERHLHLVLESSLGVLPHVEVHAPCVCLFLLFLLLLLLIVHPRFQERRRSARI